MRKFVILFVCGVFLTTVLSVNHSYAGEIDLLLEKLVEKGVLSGSEAQQIKIETKEAMKKEIAQAKSEVLPSWIQTMKLKGDFRLRYQMNRTDNANDTFSYRNRGRFRLRLGVESKVNDKLKVAAGLSTGITTAGEPDAARSTNQSFTDAFAKKPVAWDYAYAEYNPFTWASVIAGKMKNPLWEPTDMIWDTDINPEGGIFKLSKRLIPELDLFATAGAFVLDEISSDSADPMMYVTQFGGTYKVGSKASLKGSFSYYNFSNVKHRNIEGASYDFRAATPGQIAFGNSRENVTGANTGRLRYGYSTLTPALELNIKQPLEFLGIRALDIPQLQFFGEYVENPLVERANTGYSAGFKFGAEKIANFGDWDFKYDYVMLGRDAVPDFLPDSDRYGGTTGIRSHEAIFQFGLGPNTYLSGDYYYSARITKPHVPEHLVQVDWNMKF